MNRELHSVHSFMFPFRWDYLAADKRREKIPFSERVDVVSFDRLFTEQGLLRRKTYHLGADFNHYNEYTYFHSHVRKALFFTRSLTESDVIYYELTGNDTDYYKIHIRDEGELELHLESICMHIYKTGVGILTYNLQNFTYPEKETILKINEFGRRLYPQFISDNSLDATRKAFLPERLELKIGHRIIQEDYTRYLEGLQPGRSFIPPAFVEQVFGSGEGFVFCRSDEKKGRVRISKITDDRMFFLSWYGNPKSRELTIDHVKWNDRTYYDDTYSPWWYAYIFGDKQGPSLANGGLMQKYLEEVTYERWRDYGTLFGITRDSFVIVSDTLAGLKRNGAPNLSLHTQTLYYQMAVLCLAQRASILRFSYEASNTSDSLGKNTITKDILDLDRNFMQFVNKMSFREVTSQIQGIEIYDMFQKAMNIEKEIQELKNQVSEMHDYVNTVEQANISRIANWFLPVSLLLSFLGLGIFTKENLDLPFIHELNLPFVWLGLLLAFTLGFNYVLKTFKK